MWMVQDYMIHKFVRERGGKALKQDIFEALGTDEETKRIIGEKLTMMARFGIITIEGDVIRIK